MSERAVDGYEPRFDLDYERGRQGELFVDDIIAALRTESVEVKTDDQAQRTGNVYVEYECLRHGEYVPSGLATTDAEMWAFVIEDGQMMVALPTEKLKEIARSAIRAGRTAECKRGSHPTRGVTVPLTDLVRWGTKAGRGSVVRKYGRPA